MSKSSIFTCNRLLPKLELTAFLLSVIKKADNCLDFQSDALNIIHASMHLRIQIDR